MNSKIQESLMWEPLNSFPDGTFFPIHITASSSTNANFMKKSIFSNFNISFPSSHGAFHSIVFPHFIFLYRAAISIIRIEIESPKRKKIIIKCKRIIDSMLWLAYRTLKYSKYLRVTSCHLHGISILISLQEHMKSIRRHFKDDIDFYFAYSSNRRSKSHLLEAP